MKYLKTFEQLNQKLSMFAQEQNPDAFIKYYVSWMNDRDEIQDFYDTESEAKKNFEIHKKNDDDTHLYKALVTGDAENGYEAYFAEVIASHAPDEN